MSQPRPLSRFSRSWPRAVGRWGLAVGCSAALALLFAGPFLWRYWQDWQFARDVAALGGMLDYGPYGSGPIYALKPSHCNVLLGECDVDDLWLARHRAALGQLPGRLYLELIGTSVGDAGLAQLIGLELQSLSLDSTQVTDEGLSHVAKIQSLEGVSLSNTQVTDAGLAGLQQIPRLKGLGLDSTQVTDEGLSHLTQFKRLEGLSLCNTPITDGGLARLQQMPCLRNLTLGGPRISDATVALVGQLRGLRYLSLRDTRITDAAIKHLKTLPLNFLLLDSIQVSDAGLPALAQLGSLEWLHLSNMQITDAGLQQLKGMAKLRELHLRGTRVTAAGAAVLQNAMPSCQITVN